MDKTGSRRILVSVRCVPLDMLPNVLESLYDVFFIESVFVTFHHGPAFFKNHSFRACESSAGPSPSFRGEGFQGRGDLS